MKFTLNRLKNFLDTNAELEVIVNALTMLGLEVEEVIDKTKELEDFEVAEILDTSPHPDADKLQICTVRTSEGNLGIVCGASNARGGLKTVLAKIGTIIPNGGFKIKQSKIRGIDSRGMLCSAEELNIKTEESGGIIELPQNAKVGDKIADYLGLNDPVIHINVTPNRGDALGLYGIARDLAAAGLGALRPWKTSGLLESLMNKDRSRERVAEGNKKMPDINLIVDNSDACPLYAVREVKNINNSVSPKQLKDYLESIGISSISPVVDVTNYISHAFGQPMHAYDADKLKGDLVVETLTAPAKFIALNDKEYNLAAGDLIIRDDKSIHCLAGIIGGKESACNENTSRIILEAACFNGKYIARTGRRLMIDTESRYRFERNVDLNFTLEIMDYATELLTSILMNSGGERKVLNNEVLLPERMGQTEGSSKIMYKNLFPPRESSSVVTSSATRFSGITALPLRTLDFPVNFLEIAAGFSLASSKIIRILNHLGFSCVLIDTSPEDTRIKITVPSWRRDVSIKEDIVEEIVRIHGYNNIPLTPLPCMIASKIISSDQRRATDLKRLTATLGYTEIISWSFTDSKKAALFTDLKDELTLLNPISSDLNYMRPSILPNLLKIACNNINRSYKDLSIFELGPIFHDPDNASPIKFLTGIRIGLTAPRSHHDLAQEVNIFDIKSDVEIIFAELGIELDKCRLKNEAPRYYHPGRSCAVSLGKNILGYFGQIHPYVALKFDIDKNVTAFEIDLSSLPFAKEKYGKKPEFNASDYQVITRDYAFIIDEEQSLGEILSFIKNSDKKLIKSISLFDIYRGDKIETGKQSIAISVTIQDDNKTLGESDIQAINNVIITGVENKFNAKLRNN